MSRLQEFYKETVAPKLIEQFGYKSAMEVPAVTKISLNMGLGDMRGFVALRFMAANKSFS